MTDFIWCIEKDCGIKVWLIVYLLHFEDLSEKGVGVKFCFNQNVKFPITVSGGGVKKKTHCHKTGGGRRKEERQVNKTMKNEVSCSSQHLKLSTTVWE